MAERRAARLTGFDSTVRFGLAAMATLVAYALQATFVDFLGPPFILFYPTVVLSALLGGLGPGLLSTLLSAALAWLAFMPNPHLNEAVSLVVFTVMGALVSLVAGRLRFAHDRATSHEEELARRATQIAELKSAKLDAVFHSVADGISVFDARGEPVLLNEAQARINGFASADAMMKNLAYFATIYEFATLEGQVVPMAEWPLSRVLRGESFTDYELRGRRTDTGQHWYFSFSGEAVKNEAGEVLRAVVVTRDITSKKQAEQRLLAERTRLAVTLKSITDGVIATDGDQRVTLCNGVAASLIGLTPDALVGQSVQTVGSLESLQPTLEQALQQGAVGRFTTNLLGHEVATTVAPIRDEAGFISGALIVLRDQSDERAAQAALKESEARYRAVFEQAEVGVTVVETASGRYLQVNQAFASMLGYQRAELVGRRWQEVTVPDDVADGVKGVDQMLQNRSVYRAEKRYLHKQGHVVWGKLTVSPVELGTDSATQIAMVEDITEQRLVSLQLAQAQKLESIGRLAGGVAHDFNNLLTVILSSVELMRADLDAGAPLNTEDLDQVNFAGERARDLTRQLLSFARRQPISPVSLDLNSVVTNSSKMLQRLVGEDIDLRCELQPGLWRTFADAGQVEQVIMNLAVNARDAMLRGGRLSIVTSNCQSAPGSAPAGLTPGDWVRLVVKDSGVGLSAEARAHLFEPFFTTKEQGKGTGLGLPTVYGIVTRAGGHVLVESEPGQGTAFELYFPRLQRPVVEATSISTGPVLGGTERVLIVEDDRLVQEVTERTLTSAGYDVLCAPSPRAALALPAERLGSVRLLITDVVMPELDGRALADALHAQFPSMKVLFVSGYTHDAIADHGVSDADLGFLAKPYSRASLLSRVRAVLDAA